MAAISTQTTSSLSSFSSSTPQWKYDVFLSFRGQGSNEDIQAFAELALKCIKKKGDERLAMREVTLELRRIQHLTWSNKIMKLVQLKHR
ncbi:hypothetical protein ACB092_11G029700 [Castanea dentata]